MFEELLCRMSLSLHISSEIRFRLISFIINIMQMMSDHAQCLILGVTGCPIIGYIIFDCLAKRSPPAPSTAEVALCLRIDK